jgi:hydrogenase-4 component B
MAVFWFLAALGILTAAGFCALVARNRLASRLGQVGSILGCVAGLAAALLVLLDGISWELRAGWELPYGSFYIGIDALSAFFLVPLFFVSLLAAIYGGSYLRAYREHKRLGSAWFFFNLLIASMALLVATRNGMLFLIAWEGMSLSSFFLVMFEADKPETQAAGWKYLVATHLATGCLMALFVLLGSSSGSLDFSGPVPVTPGAATAVFLLALAGFGSKAGIVPFHVWLPEAHPAAPSHVSALMSGVMIKMGVYGLMRVLTMLGPPPAWWGFSILAVGLISGVLGVLFALGQHDLKRLLAFHSVENVGIIFIGLGLGLLGVSFANTPLAVLGFAGGLLHVVNHALFKSLLFLGSGAVYQATGTRELDRLGGLKMPVTGALFLIGSAAICGLPLLNGFVSELFIYLAAFKGIQLPQSGVMLGAVAALTGLALIGGLAAACFAKAFGIAFLGQPRSAASAGARDPGWEMLVPMAVLAAACLAIGLGFLGLIDTMNRPIVSASGLSSSAVALQLGGTKVIFGWVFKIGTVFLAAAGLMALGRRFLLSKRIVSRGVTWDCGYVRPTPRMQYTASSFAQPIVGFFSALLRPKRRFAPLVNYFPQKSFFHSELPDVFLEWYQSAFGALDRFFSTGRWLQGGRVHFYVLFIAMALIFLLIWGFSPPGGRP